tara:strand:- start:5349 stop:5783 length:435 start_codon:yes stop_codon:yes gene_type:complete
VKTLSADKPLHAACVGFPDAAVLILGESGAGKSALALTLMAYGAQLVADDRVVLRVENSQIVASAPATISGLIEARGVGILNAEFLISAPLSLIVDLDEMEQDRLPTQRHMTVAGHDLPLLRRVDGLHFAPAILQFLRAGRSER